MKATITLQAEKNLTSKSSCNSLEKRGAKTCKNFLNTVRLLNCLLLKCSWNKKFDTFFINKLFAPHLTRHSQQRCEKIFFTSIRLRTQQASTAAAVESSLDGIYVNTQKKGKREELIEEGGGK